jgi:hypothetical protein
MAETKAIETTESAPSKQVNERYIPYSGGCMGWFENSGVPKRELPNNYRLGSALDGDAVRKKQFERWGEVQNRRGEERVRVPNPTKVVIVTQAAKLEASTRDLSANGMRVQFLEDTTLRKKEDVRVQILAGKGSTVALEVQAQVMWVEKSGKLRSVWNMGLSFRSMTPEQQKKMADIILKSG